MWVHTLVELWAWGQKTSAVCDRSDSPWDDQFRRPSHADKCASLRREVFKRTFFETFGHSRKSRKIARASLRREVFKRTFFETFGHSRKSRKIAQQFYKLMKLAA